MEAKDDLAPMDDRIKPDPDVRSSSAEQLSSDAQDTLSLTEGQDRPASSGKSSGEKKKKPKGPSLEEVKHHQRQLRSGKKDVGLFGLMGSLSLEDIQDQPHNVGVIYNERMTEHVNLWDEKYPEKPDRFTKPLERCQQYGLIDRCVRIPSRLCTEEEILLRHGQEILDKVKESAHMSKEQLMDFSSLFDCVFFHPSTYELSRMAAGCTMELMEQVMAGKVRNGMAIVRPPGHHAMENECNGYCVFNNVAIAAKHAVNNMGLNRVLVVDWDIHHGQGTQYAFYDDPRVLYFSIHRYDHGEFWPNLRESEYDFIGEGKGKGFNFNVPLNQTEMADQDYLAIMQQLLLPVAYEFHPQLILVSAGYDAAIGCPEGEMMVTPACYAHFINLLMPLAKGKLCVVLEGGYCIKSLSEGVALTLRALLDDPTPVIPPLPPPCPSMVESILNVIKVMRPFWKSLQYQGVVAAEQVPEVSSSTDGKKIVFMTPENRPERFDISGDDHPALPPERVIELDQKIDLLIAETNLSKSPNRTCLVYDPAMREHHCTTMGGHPERPDRISRIYQKHEECGLVDRCKVLQSRLATEEELSLVHSSAHVEWMGKTAHRSLEELQSLESSFNSIYFSEKAYNCACLAAGCMLNVVDEVVSGQSQNGVAIIRPPGHHAEHHTAAGFCFFNTVAIAARYAQRKYNLNRILILDWDVHHGNGTQHMFEDESGILYMSLHRYDYGTFYPGSTDANYDRVGLGEGMGFNVNVPWNGRGKGDAEYIAAFQQIVLPIAYEYGPELILVSAGFDAAMGDPLGGFDITPEGYAHMTRMLMGLANGRVILALEGGYNLISISDSMALCTSTLLGDLCPQLPKLVPSASAVQTICSVLDAQKSYWKSLKFRVDLPGKVKKEAGGGDGEVTSTSPEPAPEKAGGTKGEGDLYDFLEQLKALKVSDGKSETEESESTEASAGKVSSIPSEISATDITVEQEDLLAGAAGGSDMAHCSQTVRDFLGENVGGIDLDSLQMFAVVPLPWCPHLDMVQPLPPAGLHTASSCKECQHVGENWVCLTCYEVHCSRFVNEHMLFHGVDSGHLMVLSYADLSVWCYGCDSYVHNEALLPAKRTAHLSKFGEDMPGV